MSSESGTTTPTKASASTASEPTSASKKRAAAVALAKRKLAASKTAASATSPADATDATTASSNEPDQNNKKLKTIQEESTQSNTSDSSSSSSSSSSPSSSKDEATPHSSAGFVPGGADATALSTRVVNPLTYVNNYFGAWCKLFYNVEKVFYFKNFDFDLLMDMISGEKASKGKSVASVSLSFKDGDHKYSAIQTPIGVLSYNKITFEGNLNDPKFPPSKPEQAKQSIMWSSKAWIQEGVDEADPINDKVGMEFVRFLHAFTLWLMIKLEVHIKSAAMKKFYDNALALWKMSQRDPKAPLDIKEIVRFFRGSKFQELVAETKYGFHRGTFSTQLLREMTTQEKAQFDVIPYTAHTPWLQSMYDQHKLVLNDRVKIYVLKSEEELVVARRQKESPYKQVRREDFMFADGDLGMIQFQPQFSTTCGPDKCGFLGYLAGVIWYGKGNEMSTARPVPKCTASIEDMPELLENIVLPGRSDYYAERFNKTKKMICDNMTYNCHNPPSSSSSSSLSNDPLFNASALD